MRLQPIFAAAACAALASCMHPVDSTSIASFGQSVAAMHDAQAMPSTPSDEPPESSGAVGAGAVERYSTGDTRPLLPTATSSANPSSE